MRRLGLLLAVGMACALGLAVPAVAQTAADPMEKVALKPHRVKGLLLGYGYTLGEFSGEVRTSAASTRAPLYASDKAATVFTIATPGRPAPVTVSCAGGESLLALGWIEFRRRDLAYNCRFEGGPSDATFSLALSEAPLLAALYQPQRAAELVWDGATVRAITRKVDGALPISGGRTQSYKILKTDREIGGLVRGVLQPTFYLPPAGSPDREAAAVMALALFFFADPSDRQEAP